MNVCIPTLNRYDKLKELIDSLTSGSRVPDGIYILDNGGRFDIELLPKLKEDQLKIIYKSTFGTNIGVAGSWNYFIRNVSDIRIICNDDIVFDYDALEQFEKQWSPEYMTWASGAYLTNAFSCFAIPDYVVNKIGFFDETISPNYAYFEDNDYFRRIQLSGMITPVPVLVNVKHSTSSTLKGFTAIEKKEHHRKFKIAKENYIKKWGGTPGNEKYLTPYNR